MGVAAAVAAASAFGDTVVAAASVSAAFSLAAALSPDLLSASPLSAPVVAALAAAASSLAAVPFSAGFVSAFVPLWAARASLRLFSPSGADLRPAATAAGAALWPCPSSAASAEVGVEEMIMSADIAVASARLLFMLDPPLFDMEGSAATPGRERSNS